MTVWIGIAVVAVSLGAQAQAIHKCVGKDGKTSYSNSPCPGSKEVKPPAAPAARPAAAAGISAFPEVQPGKWKLRITRESKTRDEEMCGNPLDGFQGEVRSYAANTQWGCTMTANASGPRSVIVVYDCPSDRAPDGRPVQKGRTEMSLVSSSPQAFRLEMKSTAYSAHVMEGTRIGECERR